MKDGYIGRISIHVDMKGERYTRRLMCYGTTAEIIKIPRHPHLSHVLKNARAE